MPVLDGVEATRRIRIHEESAARQPAFIVALTGACCAAGVRRADGAVSSPLSSGGPSGSRR